MEHRLTARDLLRMAGGVAYLRGLYSAIEGLAGRPRERGNILLGRVLWCDRYRTRLQLVPPFENRCSCPEAGACRHVVTLGLTHLHQERQRAGGVSFPSDESTFYEVVFLEEQPLRGLVLELLATLPGATEVAAEFLTQAARGVAAN
jgi:uncharacterized Zn finger protein